MARVKVWQVLWGNKAAKKLHGKESGLQGVAKGHLQIVTMYGAINASGLEVGKRSLLDEGPIAQCLSDLAASF